MIHVPHTPYDAAILSNQIRRVMGWRGAGDMIKALLHACGDYMHPCPTDWEQAVADRERAEDSVMRRIVVQHTYRMWGQWAAKMRQIQFTIDDGKTIAVCCTDPSDMAYHMTPHLRGAKLTLCEGYVKVEKVR